MALSWCLVLAGTVANAPAGAALPDMAFRAASLEVGGQRLEGVAATLGPSGDFRIDLQQPPPGLAQWLPGSLTVRGVLRDFKPGPEALQLRAGLEALDLSAEFVLQQEAGATRAEVRFANQPLSALQRLQGLPAALDWVKRGRFGLDLDWLQAVDKAPHVAYRLRIDDLAFDSPDGRFAAEALVLGLSGRLEPMTPLAANVSGAVRGGEVLIDEFYRDFSQGALDFSAQLRADADGVRIAPIRLDDGEALTVEAGARIGAAADEDWALEVSHLSMRFPEAYRRYLEPLAAGWTLNGLEVTGALDWSGQWESGDLVSGDLDIRDFSAVDTQRGRFAITGLDARLRPGDYSFDSRLSWRGLLFGRINLGPGTAALDSEPGTVALQQPLALGVLGGKLVFEQLKFLLPGSRADAAGEADLQLRARIDSIDMEQLTAALDWPSFSGQLSGDIPGVSLEQGVLDVDGEIRISVFDGAVAVRDLRIERPFGVLPSLAAQLEISDLDLEQLTRTFSFGRISGRLGGYVHELRMLDWAPVSFDAWLGTPQDQQRTNDISRQAVNNLTTLGGGRATAALTSPLMRMFSSFSYRRLGMGCRLQNNICAVRGIGEDDVSVLILEGAGVPRITIRAFNRNVDWPQMVANLAAVSAGQSVSVGAPPDG
jgi:hypothetical protein